MSATPGWYPDPSNPQIMRFWNGSEWTTGRSVPVGIGEQPAARTPATTGTSTTGVQFQMPQLSTLAWLTFGGVALVALGAMLPWVEVHTAYGYSVRETPQGGSAFLFWLLGAAIVALAWPARTGTLSKARCIGLTVIGSYLTLCAFTNIAAVGKLNDEHPGAGISGGMGLWIYTLGTGLIVAGIVKAWLARRKEAAASATSTVLA